MEIKTEDDAFKFIVEAEFMLKILDLTRQGKILVKNIQDEYGLVTDFSSFKKFLNKFLKKCPNKEIVKDLSTDLEAKKIWDSIDSNKNGLIDESEHKILIKKMFVLAKKLVKSHFDI